MTVRRVSAAATMPAVLTWSKSFAVSTDISSPRVLSEQAAMSSMLSLSPVLMRAPLACSSSFTLTQ